jgi:hypothetical protein
MNHIGQRVKVIDQEITGTIIRHDTGNKWVVLDDDRNDWAEEGEEGVLVYRASELAPMSIKQRYLRDPNFCPECESRNITAHQSTFEHTQAWQAITCDDCDAEWHDLFTLSSYELTIGGEAV